MTQDNSPKEDNNSGQDARPETVVQGELRVLAQYVKDLSFENPEAPQSLTALGQGSGPAPQIDVSVGVTIRRHDNEQYETELKLAAHAKRGEAPVFVVELVYGGLFLLRNLPEESIKPLLHIECPRLLFPYARRILADAVRDGGFPPLLLDPIDFAGLYRQRLQQERAATPKTLMPEGHA
jgi:preprotein translocase subunit SecB